MIPFDRYDLTSYAGRTFTFREHGNASFLGRGPWRLADGETGTSPGGGSCALRFEPVPEEGFSYSPVVFVWAADVPETFHVHEPEPAR